jgi:cytoskeleton protein RodZ
VIAFKVKSSTWVRVTDAKGVVQFEKTLAAGESGAASGLLPLSVVVGNVGATEVSVRGQPYALDAYAKDNVARFEVK